MAYYRKRPVVVQALQITESVTFEEVARFVGRTIKVRADGRIVIPTLEGDMTANLYDWIIKGVQGEPYPCKPDIFELTYEAVS